MAPPPEEPLEPLSGEATPSSLSGGSGLPDTAKELALQVEELTRQLAALTEAVRREHERAAHREQVIDRLHAENQQLRHGLLQEALTPVRAGLYRLHDTVTRGAARWRGTDPPAPELAGKLLSALADEVAEVLGRTGAERVAVKPGDAYDAALHRPAKTSVVGPDADGTVVEVLDEGFTMGERVLRKASVVVGRAAPQSETAHPEKRKTPKDQKKQSGSEAPRQHKDRKDIKDQPPRDGTKDKTPEQTDGGTEKESE
ncbi:hypothetical protein GCM10022226_79830 [Sphaerisporangium flaviroseum]|uniref:Nucleotide exchange factor GrpE n=1 Tax=Sphaerisporangium flaviroseum TaxID=509199 RepID=A0ABP7JIV8_9ACTN